VSLLGRLTACLQPYQLHIRVQWVKAIESESIYQRDTDTVGN
jgi:hypothetical protein